MYLISKPTNSLANYVFFILLGLLGSPSFMAANLDEKDQELYKTIENTKRSLSKPDYAALARLLYNTRNHKKERDTILKKLESFSSSSLKKQDKNDQLLLEGVVTYFKNNPLKDEENREGAIAIFKKLLMILDTTTHREAITDLLDLAIFQFESEELIDTILAQLEEKGHLDLNNETLNRHKRINDYFEKLLKKQHDKNDKSDKTKLENLGNKLIDFTISYEVLVRLYKFMEYAELRDAQTRGWDKEIEKNKKLISEKQKLVEEKTELEDANTRLENEKNSLNSKLDLEKAKVQELKDELAKYDHIDLNNPDDPNNVIKNLNDKVKNLKTEKENIVKANKELDTKITNLTQERDTHKAEYEKIKNNIPKDTKELHDKVTQLEKEKKQLEKENQKLLDAKKDSSDSDPNNSTLGKENQKLNKRNKIKTIIIIIGAVSILVSMIIHVMNIPKVQEMIQNIRKRGKKDSRAKEDDDEIDQMTEY